MPIIDRYGFRSSEDPSAWGELSCSPLAGRRLAASPLGQHELRALLRPEITQDAVLLSVRDQLLERLPGREHFEITIPVCDRDLCAVRRPTGTRSLALARVNDDRLQR